MIRQIQLQHPRPKARIARGFTLIELLLAIAIVAVIAAALFQTIFSAFKAKSTAEDAMEPVARAGITMDFISRDFASALMPAGDVTVDPATGQAATTAVPQPLAFEFQGIDNTSGDGDSDDVWFYAATDTPMIPYGGPTQIQNGGNGAGATGGMMSQNFGKGTAGGLNGGEALNTDMRRVEYCCEVVDNENCLVRRVQSNLLADQDPDPDAEMEVLCRGVKSFNVEYFDGTDWQTSWDSSATTPANMIPVAVRITLELRSPNNPDAFKRMVKVVSMACYVDLATANSSTGTGL